MSTIIIRIEEYQFKIDLVRKTIRRVTSRLLPNFHFSEITDIPGSQYWGEVGRYPYKEALEKFKKLRAFI